ncbi:MAG: hypothetical protein HY910_04960 [Desulfarculus sp.]|nr:hypothetical protein [Desulfarculus sp.]
MKRIGGCLCLLVAIAACYGCLDASRAAKQSVDVAITEKVSEKVSDKAQGAAAIRKVLANSLFLADRTMLANGMIKIDDSAIKFEYGEIKAFTPKNEGKEVYVRYEDRHNDHIKWSKLIKITIKGPYVMTHSLYHRGLTNMDYYDVWIIYEGWITNSGRRVNFANLDGAKGFAALAVRMAELSGNPGVKTED